MEKLKLSVEAEKQVSAGNRNFDRPFNGIFLLTAECGADKEAKLVAERKKFEARLGELQVTSGCAPVPYLHLYPSLHLSLYLSLYPPILCVPSPIPFIAAVSAHVLY